LASSNAWRHSFVSIALAAGVPLVTVASWAGRDPKVAASVYAHLPPDSHEADAERLGEAFGARHLRDNRPSKLGVVSGHER
jgi:hypothetical protein